MSETRKTIIYAAAAVVLALLAFAVSPSHVTPDAFSDQGEKFFPDFTDPNSARVLEVVEYNEETGAARPFKVHFTGGLWTIPSHHDYPADAEDRLAKTAAGVIDLRKDEFRTDNVADQERCGVIDPLDESAAGLSGRGTRVTLKADEQNVLADLIFGKPVEGKQGYRFVRVPGQKRVYASKVDVDLSTRFADWIDTDLLKIERDKIDQVVFDNYSVNERTLKVDRADQFTLSKSDQKWRLRGGGAIDSAKVEKVLIALDDLSIEGVRPKPKGFSAGLKEGKTANLTDADVVEMQQKGFYLARDGQLMANDGEVRLRTTDGVTYSLRFGEVLYGEGLTVSAGATGADETAGQAGSRENRYLFVTADFDEDYFDHVREPKNKDFQNLPDSLWTDEDRQAREQFGKYQAYQRLLKTGRDRAAELNQRFADWYYVISGDSFTKIHVRRADLKATES